MKRICNINRKVHIWIFLFILWFFAIPCISLAQDNNCNRFWGKCHTEGINTIRTTDEDVNAWLLDTIKNAINRCLAVLATVVLCFCLYGWFQMLTSWSDSKWYDNWRKTLKNALIWLAIILLARMIVSVVFWFVGSLSWWNQTKGASVQ